MTGRGERVNFTSSSQGRWMFLLALLFLTPQATGQPVALPDRASVSRETIWLSDLLPLNSPPALRRAAEKVALGRSPQPGSVRALDAEQVAEALAGAPDLLRSLALPRRVLIQRSGWTVRREAILEALARFFQGRLESSAGPEPAVEFPDDIVSQEENPALEVVAAVGGLRGQGFEVQMRCVRRASCRSFLVHLLGPRSRSFVRLPGTASLGSSTRQGLPAQELDGPILAESGKKAVLLLEGKGMSLSLPVTCLERGRLSQTIRVLDASRHRVMKAEVVGAGKLHARL